VRVAIGLANFKIRLQERDYEVHQFSVVQYLAGRPVETPQLLLKFEIRQLVGGWIVYTKMWGTATGDKNVSGRRAVMPTQMTREFKTDNGPHAVTEEGKGPVEVWENGISNGFHQRLIAREKVLYQSPLPPGQVRRANCN